MRLLRRVVRIAWARCHGQTTSCAGYDTHGSSLRDRSRLAKRRDCRVARRQCVIAMDSRRATAGRRGRWEPVLEEAGDHSVDLAIEGLRM